MRALTASLVALSTLVVWAPAAGAATSHTTLSPSSAEIAHSTFGTMPAAIEPARTCCFASGADSIACTSPLAFLMPATSVRRISFSALRPRAISAAATSAFTL